MERQQSKKVLQFDRETGEIEYAKRVIQAEPVEVILTKRKPKSKKSKNKSPTAGKKD